MMPPSTEPLPPARTAPDATVNARPEAGGEPVPGAEAVSADHRPAPAR
jgi:hypothetical protein